VKIMELAALVPAAAALAGVPVSAVAAPALSLSRRFSRV